MPTEYTYIRITFKSYLDVIFLYSSSSETVIRVAERYSISGGLPAGTAKPGTPSRATANLLEATSLEVLVWWMLAGEVPLAQWHVRDNIPLPLGGLSEMALDTHSFPRRSAD